MSKDAIIRTETTTFAYKCPICYHSHFEILSYGELRCFSCGATFKKDQLEKVSK